MHVNIEIRYMMYVQAIKDIFDATSADLLISRGRCSASLEEIRSLTGLSDAAIASGLQRLRRQRRGFLSDAGSVCRDPA